MKTRQPSRKPESGFTRGDLLIVVALILLLGVVQLPSFGNTRASSEAVTCANHLRRLIQAWSMYADDHDGRLVPNHRTAGSHSGGPTWSEGWLDFSLTGSSSNIARLVDPTLTNGRTGLLGPYLKRDASVFKCPADRGERTIFGRPFASIRSVAMNNWMGGDAYQFQTGFKVFRHLDEITRPTPAQALVFIEARLDAVGDGVFSIDMLHGMPSHPAAYHDGGAHLSFADGHVAYRAWIDPRTAPPPPGRGELIPINAPMLGNPDLEFLRAGATAWK
jgi:prepilin-type processing-associated H-X9-DG protein